MINQIIQLGVHIRDIFYRNHFYNNSTLVLLVQFHNQFILISCMNRSHTVLLKAKINYNTNLTGVYELTIFQDDTFKIRELDLSDTNDADTILQFSTFNNELFNTGWKLLTVDFVRKILETIHKSEMEDWDNPKAILFVKNGNESLISTSGLNEVFLSVPFNLKIKLLSSDVPLALKYDYYGFEIFCVIAPLLPDNKMNYSHVAMVIK